MYVQGEESVHLQKSVSMKRMYFIPSNCSWRRKHLSEIPWVKIPSCKLFHLLKGFFEIMAGICQGRSRSVIEDKFLWKTTHSPILVFHCNLNLGTSGKYTKFAHASDTLSRHLGTCPKILCSIQTGLLTDLAKNFLPFDNGLIETGNHGSHLVNNTPLSLY